MLRACVWAVRVGALYALVAPAPARWGPTRSVRLGATAPKAAPRNPRWRRYEKRRLAGFGGASPNAYATVKTTARVVLPALVAAAVGVEYYDNLSAYINANWLDASSIRFLSSDEIQFIPSFLTVLSLLFSILAGNAYQSLYNQQEAIFFALSTFQVVGERRDPHMVHDSGMMDAAGDFVPEYVQA